MIQRNFKLALTAGRTIPLVIPASQYDSGEQWIFTLIDETGAKYTPESGAIIGIKSDKMAILNAGTVDAAGRVVINETEQMTAAVGKNVFEILINDQTHGSANFIVMVEPRPGDNADFSDSDLSLLQQAIDGTSETAIKAGVQEWMDENLTDPTDPIVDASLSLSGAAADAKKTGDEISDLKSAFANIDGFTPEIKSALMDVVEHILWSNGNAQNYIQNLRNALYPSETPAELVSISAVFTQGDHTIYDTDALDTLKQYLVVTAHYDDSSTATVASADYTLSGTLTEGSSTITVNYGGCTDSFVVTVTEASSGEVELQDVYTNLGVTQANVYEGADDTSTKLCTYYTTSMFGFASDETFPTDTVVNIKASATNLTTRHIFAGNVPDIESTTLDAFYGADLGAISSMGNGVPFTVKAGNKLVIICNFQRNTSYTLTVSAERS